MGHCDFVKNTAFSILNSPLSIFRQEGKLPCLKMEKGN